MKEFTIAGMATKLAELAIGDVALNEAMLEYIGVTVEKAAKEKFGEYQEQAGPFVGWAQLADATMADREAKGFPEDEPLLRTGGLRESIGHTVGVIDVQIGSDDPVLEYQELGTSKMPPRSTLGGAAFEQTPKIIEHCGVALTAFLVGENVFQGKMKVE